MKQQTFAPGARILHRDAEWLVRKVESTSTCGHALHCTGLSEIVKDKEMIFLTEIEPSIKLLDPAHTTFRHDTSQRYSAAMLYLESMLRQSPPTDDDLYIGHKAAMDPLPYQLEPALEALQQPRQRILIADAVGLGKTLEAGILLSELIKRGKGKRILVVAIKSMLTQFQKELWSRFTIPLTRLDSIGLGRVITRIPTNHNPFYYFDKSIISIDTLKQDNRFRAHLRKARWDIIVIDEAHNVADRGTSAMRNRVARELSRQSDTLIMLSATPHDGRPESFASLMNMLDPTAIANPKQYTKDDIKGLYVRRFKKDIINQVTDGFHERHISRGLAKASDAEEHAYDILSAIQFQKLDSHTSQRGFLFKTLLEKSLFSSPAACLVTIQNRLHKIKKQTEQLTEKNTTAAREDIAKLQLDKDALLKLAQAVEAITPKQFSKLQYLINYIQTPTSQNGLGWNKNNASDRLVIFTERRETLSFLKRELANTLSLKANTKDGKQSIDKDQLLELHGGMSDIEQQQVVEAFGKEKANVRLLVASDVASEGINLHYLSHKMIHFDIPWSLMVFQQRNGRIDRYGQTQPPHITYLFTEAKNEKIRDDQHILDILTKKDEQTDTNVGDPSAFMGVYDVEQEELFTAHAIQSGASPQDFDASLEANAQKKTPDAFEDDLDDLFAAWQDDTYDVTKEIAPQERCHNMPSLFADDYTYTKHALSFLTDTLNLQVNFQDKEKRIELTSPTELKERYKFLPREIWPKNGAFYLSSDIHKINEVIKQARKEEDTWPSIQYLWDLHPIVHWLNDRVRASFARQEAPALFLKEGMEPNEHIILMTGVLPNRQSHPTIFRWFGASFLNGTFRHIEPLTSILERTQLHKTPLINDDSWQPDHDALNALRAPSIEQAKKWMAVQRNEFIEKMQPKNDEKLALLRKRADKQRRALEASRGSLTARKEAEYKERRIKLDRDIKDYEGWLADTYYLDNEPYIQIVAAFIALT